MTLRAFLFAVASRNWIQHCGVVANGQTNLVTPALRFLADNKDAFDAFESVATVLAFAVAAYWTWQLFVRRREKYPRAMVTHEISHWHISDTHRLVRLALRIKNESDVLLCLSEGHTWVQQLEPPPPELLKAVETGENSFPKSNGEFTWPILAECDFKFEGQREIEPKESDDLVRDFIVPIWCKKVLIYSYVENARKPGRNMGWIASNVIDLQQSNAQQPKTCHE